MLLHRFAQSPGSQKEPYNELDEIFEEIERKSHECIDDARSFIRHCLQANPRDRMTAAEALKHDWLCTPDDDLKLFLQREKETTAGWKPREIIGDAVTELPDLLQAEAHGPIHCTTKDCSACAHVTRHTVDGGNRSTMRDIMILPPNQEMSQRWRMRSTVSQLEAREQPFESLEESGMLPISPQYEELDEDVDMDWPDELDEHEDEHEDDEYDNECDDNCDDNCDDVFCDEYCDKYCDEYCECCDECCDKDEDGEGDDHPRKRVKV